MPNFDGDNRVLFVISFETYFGTLSKIAIAGKASGTFVPVIYFPSEYPNFKRDQEFCKKNNLDFMGGVRSELSSTRSRALLKRMGRRLKSLLGESVFLYLYDIAFRFVRIDRILARLRPNLIVLGGDITGRESAWFIRSGHRHGIKSLIISSWMAGPAESASLLAHSPLFHLSRLGNRIFGSLNPKWVFEHEGKKILRTTWQLALALKLTGFAPPEPWILHSGFADQIIVESEFMKNYGIEDGLLGFKMVVTGAPEHDELAVGMANQFARRRDISKTLLFSEDKPMLLVALPPDLVSTRPTCIFKTYAELVNDFISPVINYGDRYNLVVSLHPACSYETVRFIEGLGNVRISRMSVVDLIPACDLYIASVSATIQWAIACGKVVLNFDVYKFHYRDFMQVKGVVYVDQPVEYQRALDRLILEAGYFDEMKRLQEIEAIRFGRLDGGAKGRIVSEIGRLSSIFQG